jgi:hypothetical protein
MERGRKKMKVTMSTEILASVHSISVSASKDDITPVITQIAITREGDALRAMATDRFMVATGRYSNVEFDDWNDEETILIDPKALKSALDIRKVERYPTVPVIIEPDRETGTVQVHTNETTSLDVARLAGRISLATFPPLMKLFPRESQANGTPVMNLRPDFIARLVKLLPPEVKPDRDRLWRFEFRSDPESGGKPQPVYAVYSNGEDYELEALIQPSLMR